METAVLAAVQDTPVFCDRDATIEKVAELTKAAAGHGAELVAFSEAFVPTYPDWVWRTTPWGDRDGYARWFDQSVDIPGPACDALGAIAREHHCYLAIPVNERDGGTVYNTLCYFGPDGDLLAKHRKRSRRPPRTRRALQRRRLDVSGEFDHRRSRRPRARRGRSPARPESSTRRSTPSGLGCHAAGSM